MHESRGLTTNRAEYAFAQRLTDEGKLWFWQPRMFELPALGVSYRPDFYVVEDGCFVEVIGTVVQRRRTMPKVIAFRQAYPQYQLKVVEDILPSPSRQRFETGLGLTPWGDRVVRVARAQGATSFADMAAALEVPLTSLRWALHHPESALGLRLSARYGVRP